MPSIPIIMPQLGESIAEATVINLLVSEGDTVLTGQDLMEVETNKATMNVASPCPGLVRELLVKINESYPVGSILGHLESSADDANRLGLKGEAVSQVPVFEPGAASETAVDVAKDGSSRVEPTVPSLPVPAGAGGAGYMSPAMKARMLKYGLSASDLAGLPGSGAAGRVTIRDFEQFMARVEQQQTIPASTMRVAVADAMRRSWTRPIATVAMPVCFDPLLAHRKQCAVKPGPALYALRALAIALTEDTAPAGRLIGNRIIHPASIDVGFAVEVREGVLVPVIRKANETPISGLVGRYDELIRLAHQLRLPADATGGGIATVTNFGTFGLTWATPIPLPEQTIVLGMGAARRVPGWDEASGQFVPVMEANITLSFDHRVLDGGAAGRLLARVAQLLTSPEQL